MKIRTDAPARGPRLAVLSAALVALSVPAVSAHAATTRTTHSPTGSCVKAATLAVQDRHQLGTPSHLAEALGVVVGNRHAPCPALVDYLKQTSA